MARMTFEEMIKKYSHNPEEYPVLMEQTHKVANGDLLRPLLRS